MPKYIFGVWLSGNYDSIVMSGPEPIWNSMKQDAGGASLLCLWVISPLNPLLMVSLSSCFNILSFLTLPLETRFTLAIVVNGDYKYNIEYI